MGTSKEGSPQRHGAEGAHFAQAGKAASVLELETLRDWLCQNACTAVATEGTGSHWKPVFNVPENHMEVVLANPRHVTKACRTTRRTGKTGNGLRTCSGTGRCGQQRW